MINCRKMQISKKEENKYQSIHPPSRYKSNSWRLSFWVSCCMHLQEKASKEAGHVNDLFTQTNKLINMDIVFLFF